MAETILSKKSKKQPKIDPEIGVTEESEEIEWVVCAKRIRHIRHCYKRGCHCVPGPTIRTRAPTDPARGRP